MTEVKDEDFFKGIAQNAVQLESALTNRKRKASEMDEEGVFVGKVFGIVTDAKEWYFLECSLDDQERPRFKLSKPLVVVYENEDMEAMVERVLGHIAWLLEEVQNPRSQRVEIREFRWISLLWLDFVITGLFIINKSLCANADLEMSIVFHYQYIDHLRIQKSN